MGADSRIIYAAMEVARKHAESLRTDAAYGGRMDDGGACHLAELVEAYESGLTGSIPRFLQGYVEEAKRNLVREDNPSEYAEYQRLKAKIQ